MAGSVRVESVSVCANESGKNHNKSNIQRVDSVLRARGSFRVGSSAVYRGGL